MLRSSDLSSNIQFVSTTAIFIFIPRISSTLKMQLLCIHITKVTLAL
jgi:hypothetical protein